MLSLIVNMEMFIVVNVTEDRVMCGTQVDLRKPVNLPWSRLKTFPCGRE